MRPWRREERERLSRRADNRNIWRNLWDGFPHPYTLEEAERWLDAKAGKVPLEGAYAMVVGGEPAGTIALHPGADVERLSAEIGYWLGEDFWGRGIATSAVTALTCAAFARSPIVRIYAPVFSWNRASMRVLEKAGFTREGVLARSIVKEGVLLDRVMYAKTREPDLPYEPFVP